MVYVLVRHDIEDFDKWKAGFEAAAEFRKEGGEGSGKVYRDVDNPNQLIGFFEWESIEKAKAFFFSPEIAEAMEGAGVVGKPDIYLLEDI